MKTTGTLLVAGALLFLSGGCVEGRRRTIHYSPDRTTNYHQPGKGTYRDSRAPRDSREHFAPRHEQHYTQPRHMNNQPNRPTQPPHHRR